MKFAIEIKNVLGEVILTKYIQKEKHSIGRAPDNDIWIPDPGLDLYHAELHIRQNCLYIVDLNSENGTLKNGRIVARGKEGTRLEDKDNVLVGQHIIFVTANKDEDMGQVDANLLEVMKEEKSANDGGAIRTIAIAAAKGRDDDLFSGIVAIKKLNPRLVYWVDKTATRYEIKTRSISLGRDQTNDIALNHPSISKIHAEIYLHSGQFYIKDKNSMNGIYLNEVRVPEAKIVNHAYIRLGGIQALLVTDYSLDDAVGYEQPMSNEEMLDKLRQLQRISPSQASAIRDDLEMKHYTVPEAAILKGYFTPAEWMTIVKQLNTQKESSRSQQTPIWVVVLLVNLTILLLIAVVLMFFWKR